MTSIKTVLRAERPSADKSHVVIEASAALFRVSGKHIAGRTSEEMPPSTWRNFLDALDTAKAWARERGIKQVIVVGGPPPAGGEERRP